MKQNKKDSSTNNNKLNNFPLKKHLLMVMIIVNIVLLLTNFLILFFIPRQADKVILSRSQILAHKLQSQSAQKIITDLKAVGEDKQRLERSLPNKDMLLNIIELIESLKSGVEIESFKFEAEEPVSDAQGFNFLPLTLIIKGSMSDTMAALYKLQSSPYLFSVTSTLIESPDGLAKIIKVRTSLRIYVRQPFNQN